MKSPGYPIVLDDYSQETMRVRRIRAFAYGLMYERDKAKWAHTCRVAEQGRTHSQAIVGYCHDLVEDKFCTLDQIPELIGLEYDAIKLLTRPDTDHDYLNYVVKIVTAAKNDHYARKDGILAGEGIGETAARVKYYDLCDNLHPDRGGFVSDKHILRYVGAMSYMALNLQPLGLRDV